MSAGSRWCTGGARQKQLQLLLLLALVHASGATTTISGCTCVNDCARTIFLLSNPWCRTSQSPPPMDGSGCGKFSPSLNVFWDECVVNVTGTTPRVTLKTLPSMWWTITISCTGTTMGAFCLAGLVAALLSGARRTVLWLPLLSSFFGACQGFCVGALFAVICAFIYLSLPYAIDVSVAISLGVGLGVLLTYASLGRQYRQYEAPHAWEYNE